MSTEERVRVRPGALIFAIIFFIVLLVISDIESLYTLKPGTFFGGFAISIFWIAVINELIGRVNPRLKLNPAELLVIFSCFTFIIGANYYVRGVVGASGIFMYLDHVYTGLCAAMNIEAFKDYYLKVVPSFMFPKTARVIEMIWKGKTIGEVIPWGEFITPIAFWSLYLISVILLGVFIGFVAAKPWTEVERLVFPMSVPASYLLQVSGEGKLFKYKNAQKIFWGMFIIGVIFSILPLLTEVLPPVALVAFTGWGQTPVDIYPLAAALPGAWARGVLMIDQVALMMLLRDDVYYTAIFAYIVFGVLYQAIAVRTGIIPYEPGMEFRFNWENVPAWWPPVPYAFIGSGAAFGVGVWMLYQMRDRFKAIFRSIVGKEVVVEDGLSLRALGLLGLGAAILWLIVWTAAGVPFLISLFVLIGWFIWYVHMARVAAEFWWHNVDFCSDFPGWTLYYPIGASLGYWPWSVPPEGNNYAWFATCWLMYGSGGMWVTRTHGQGSAGMVTIYKIAHDIKMSIKDLLVANVLIVIIGVPVAAIIHTWLLASAGGMANTNAMSWVPYPRSDAFITGTGGLRPGQTFEATYGWVATGFITVILLFLIRLKFPGFIINPVILVPALACMPWIWLNALIALIVKKILIGTVGYERFEAIVRPGAAGIALGFGALHTILCFIDFFTGALPKFYSLYAP